MTEGRGQTFRRTGLMIEAVSMLTMLATHRGNATFWTRMGLDPSVVLPFLFLIGLILWVYGTTAIRKARREKMG